MWLVVPKRPRLRALFLLFAPLAVWRCGGEGGTDVVLPSLSISTSTGGIELDPDGYGVSVDGAPVEPIGINATMVIERLIDGPHTVELSGSAPNCAVDGENPRTVSARTATTATVAFAISCRASAGGIEIVTVTGGPGTDPDGFVLTLDGAERGTIEPNAAMSLADIAAGSHTVGLTGVAASCQVAAENPRAVLVSGGETAAVAFSISCAAPEPEIGSLDITTATSGPDQDPDGYTLRVDEGATQTIAANGTRTVSGLSAGAHAVRLEGLAANCSLSGDNPRSVTIASGHTTAVTFAVVCVAIPPSINLRIAGLQLTQSTQTMAGDVPLVAGRDGYLRVFVTANETNSAAPRARVRLYDGTALVRTLTIRAPRASTPVVVQEEVLSSSWNIPIPRSLIQPGLKIQADVDSEGEIPETDETDNGFPASGAQELTVKKAAGVNFTLVPVRQNANGLVGNVTDANRGRFVDLTRRIYPAPSVRSIVHAEYTTTTADPLQADNENGAWGAVLHEINALRIAEGSARNYFGVVRLDYFSGLAGVGYIGVPAALGSDELSDAGRVVAHEVGHNFGQLHTPCGGPPDPDPKYPYPAGNIGVYGLDVASAQLRSPGSSDIMGYCADPWISDYTYENVLQFRNSRASAVATAAVMAEQPCLLIWGRIVDGRPVLEPAFQIVTRPSLPRRPGPYAITATAETGSPLFALSFDAAAVADDPRGSRHFAFAVPLDHDLAARLGSLRLTGPAGSAQATSRAPAQLRTGGPTDSIVARREGESVALRWNASVHPMIMVRDPETGQVLSFARGGKVRVRTAKREVDLVVSDGVQSRPVRISVAP